MGAMHDMHGRMVKPVYFLHEGLFDLEKRTGCPVRIAFAGLWCAADREGRFRWRPRSLKARICPFDDVDFDKLLLHLSDAGFIEKYEVDGEEYGHVVNFLKHQRPNNREPASDIPPPPKRKRSSALLEQDKAKLEQSKAPLESKRNGEGSGEGDKAGDTAGGGKVDTENDTDESAATAAFDTSPTEPIQPITPALPPPDSKSMEKAEIRVKTITKYLYATYAEKSDIRLSRVALRALKNPPIHELELVERAMRDNPDLDVAGVKALFEWVMGNKHWRLKANDPAAFARHIIQITRDHASRKTIEKENDDGQE